MIAGTGGGRVNVCSDVDLHIFCREIFEHDRGVIVISGESRRIKS